MNKMSNNSTIEKIGRVREGLWNEIKRHDASANINNIYVYIYTYTCIIKMYIK